MKMNVNSTTRYKVRKVTLSDKIYFHRDDVLDVNLDYFQYSAFSHMLDKLEVNTLQYDPVTGMFSLPSGCWNRLEIEEVADLRFVGEPQGWSFKGALRPTQQELVDKILVWPKLFSGLIQAPCGWGKTFVGSYIVATYNKPTLIVCHSILLANQWFDELNKQVVGAKVGFIGDGKNDLQTLTVGIYHSLVKRLPELQDKFELIIVDESHLCPANTFSTVINGINAKVKVALSATPWRKDGLHVILPDYFGPNKLIATDVGKIIPDVKIIKTDVGFPVIIPKRDWTKQLGKLATNSKYIELVATHARDHIAHGRCLLIVAERLEMLNSLKLLIPQSVLLVGGTKNRDGILKSVGTDVKAILTTRIFDEGVSCHRLDTIYFTCPSNNQSKWEQRVGRIQREHVDAKHPLVVDFWLTGSIVQAQQRNRSEWYVRNNFQILK